MEFSLVTDGCYYHELTHRVGGILGLRVILEYFTLVLKKKVRNLN